MIVVRTNLCSELHERERAKDPARRMALLVGMVVLMALGAWWGMEMKVDQLRQELAVIEARERTLNRELTHARTREEERKAEVIKRDAVLGFAESRMNWAPMLERVLAAIPSNTDISSLSISSASRDHCTMQVAGRSAGEKPRLESDKCRLLLIGALEEPGWEVTAEFVKLEDSPEIIRIAEISYPASEFVIELRWRKTVYEG